LSQFLYSTETLQNKLVSGLSKLEDEIIKTTETYNAMKSDMEQILSNAAEKEQNLLKEIEDLKNKISKSETDINIKTTEIENKYSKLLEQEKTAHSNELESIRQKSKSEIETLNKAHSAEISEYEKRLESLLENKQKGDESINYYENLMNTISNKLKEYYETHKDKQTSWKEEENQEIPLEIIYTDFILHQVNKWESDNKWLVERLAEFGKENERLTELAKGAIKVTSPELVQNVFFSKI